MNFRVMWNRTELRELATICLRALDRKAVATAANFIERTLMIDPHHAGKPVGKRYRRLFVTPLTVEFKIDDMNQIVTVLRVQFGDHTN